MRVGTLVARVYASMNSMNPINELEAIIWERARALCTTPGELSITVSPSGRGARAHIACGLRLCRASGASITEALQALADTLADVAEADAIRAANEPTPPLFGAKRENVQAPEFRLSAPRVVGK